MSNGIDFAINIGLAGQPNTGKSSLFNRLTGAKQHVGNWPGKTVEKKNRHLPSWREDLSGDRFAWNIQPDGKFI